MKLYALLGWIDGFGADTSVIGIYDDFDDLIKNADLSREDEPDKPDRYIEFELGQRVSFNWYKACEVPEIHESTLLDNVKIK